MNTKARPAMLAWLWIPFASGLAEATTFSRRYKYLKIAQVDHGQSTRPGVNYTVGARRGLG